MESTVKRTYDQLTAERLRPLLNSIVNEIEDREEPLRLLARELRFTRRPSEAFRSNLISRIAENKRGLRLAREELAMLGCELDPSAPRLVHIPGPDGRFSSGFELVLQGSGMDLQTSQPA